MRDIIFLDKIVTPTQSKVLVEVEDTYDLKKRNSGVLLANAAHNEAEADSPGFHVSEFIIRKGIVARMPRFLTAGYDWYPENEINIGDEVFWPISRFFDYPVIKTLDGKLYLVVDYFDIHMKVEDGKPVPVNGFYLFTKQKEDKAIMEYEYQEDTGYFIIEKIGKEVIYLSDNFNYETPWKEGDVCKLNVPPFKLEAETSEEFGKEYYLAQKRHVRYAI